MGQSTNVDFDGAVAVGVGQSAVCRLSEEAAAAAAEAATAAEDAFNKLRQLNSGKLLATHVGSWQAAEILLVIFVVVNCLVNHKINARICSLC